MAEEEEHTYFGAACEEKLCIVDLEEPAYDVATAKAPT